MKSFVPVLSLLALLGVAACGDAGGNATGNSDAPALPIRDSDVGGSNVGTASAQGAAPADAHHTGANDTQPSGGSEAIPARFHGRWGLTPADCTSTRGDAKGLMLISADQLRFYESTAVPTTNVKTSPESFSADFSWTGEGMSWTKFQSLELQNGKLVRTESSPIASFTYVRCD